MTDNEEIAEAMWDTVLTGRFATVEGDRELSGREIIALATWIYDIVDGQPGQAIEIEYLGEYDG